MPFGFLNFFKASISSSKLISFKPLNRLCQYVVLWSLHHYMLDLCKVSSTFYRQCLFLLRYLCGSNWAFSGTCKKLFKPAFRYCSMLWMYRSQDPWWPFLIVFFAMFRILCKSLCCIAFIYRKNNNVLNILRIVLLISKRIWSVFSFWENSNCRIP